MGQDAANADPYREMNARAPLIDARRTAVIAAAERMVDHGMTEDGWRLLCSAVVRLRELNGAPRPAKVCARAAETTSPAGTADRKSLQDRLAALLAKIIDEPLLTVGDPEGSRRKMHLRFACFRHELGEEAAELLEEAGL